MIGEDMPRRLPPYCVEDRDRHGTVRVYLRRPGKPKVRLQGTPWTPDFMQAYADALDGKTPATRRATRRATQGTVRWMCERYFRSGEFAQLAPGTRAARRRVIETMIQERVRPDSPHAFADMPLERFDSQCARVLRDRKSATPEAANNRVKAMRGLANFAVLDNMTTINFAGDLKKIAVKTDGFHTWTLDEIAAFRERHAAGTMARRALLIYLFTGLRRGDAAIFGRQHVRNGMVKIRTAKTGATVEFPLVQELADDLARDTGGEHLAFLRNHHGKAFASAAVLGNWFKDRCGEAGLPHCAAHGLRKAGATIAAMAGASEQILNAIYGWSGSDMASLYTRAASRKTLAETGMKMLESGTKSEPQKSHS